MRRVGTGLTVLAVVGAGALALAQPVGRGVVGAGVATLKQQLGLSDQQAAELQRLRSEEQKQAIRRQADLAVARMELQEALAAKPVDEKLVAAKTKAVADLQTAALQARVNAQLAVRKVLTPEQQEKLQQLRGERRGVRAERRLMQRGVRGMRRGRMFGPGAGPLAAPGAPAEGAGPAL
jgi:Spy/CpxP family protein refolding chaperone